MLPQQFLANLYASNRYTARKLLIAASDSQLKLLLYLLHFIAIGEIPLTRENFNSISKGRKASFLFKNFADKTKTKTLLKSDRTKKLHQLFQLSSAFKHLLTRVFKLKESENE